MDFRCIWVGCMASHWNGKSLQERTVYTYIHLSFNVCAVFCWFSSNIYHSLSYGKCHEKIKVQISSIHTLRVQNMIRKEWKKSERNESTDAQRDGEEWRENDRQRPNFDWQRIYIYTNWLWMYLGIPNETWILSVSWAMTHDQLHWMWIYGCFVEFQNDTHTYEYIHWQSVIASHLLFAC